jgi:hypothetical protein
VSLQLPNLLQKLVNNLLKVCPSAALMDARELSKFQETDSYWKNWIGKSTYEGNWREAVHRSALALKLLIYEPTGTFSRMPVIFQHLTGHLQGTLRRKTRSKGADLSKELS